MTTPAGPVQPADLLKDDGPSRAATAADLQRYVDASNALSTFQVPILAHVTNPHEYLYVACFDGSGSDKTRDPIHETNVGKLSDQIFARFHEGQTHIAQGYVAGPGTEDGWIRRTLDSVSGFTYEARLEQMYAMFVDQGWQWTQSDPDAQIRLAATGFSRGAEEAAGFARLVEELGIQDPTGAIYSYNAHGEITHVQYTRPPLVPPHAVAQAVALFDAVGTGTPELHHDRRLPPSVLSGIQLIAADEHRGLFQSDHIIDPGLSDDGRFLGVYLPGAHTDVGGSDARNGLGTRAGDLAIDYLNALSDRPYLRKEPVPDDPGMSVVHRPQDGSLLYWLTPRVDRLKPGGYHELEVPGNTDLAGFRGDPYNAEPINPGLDAQFERRPVRITPPPDRQASQESARQNPLDDWIGRLYQGERSGDLHALHAVAQEYVHSALGQAWQRQVQDYAFALQAQEHALQQPAHAHAR